jgi:hypothetical protein
LLPSSVEPCKLSPSPVVKPNKVTTMAKLDRRRTGQKHGTTPKNLADELAKEAQAPKKRDREPRKQSTPPDTRPGTPPASPARPAKRRKKPYEPDELPDEWCDQDDETHVAINPTSRLDELTSLVMTYFFEESDNKMLDAMHAVAEYIAEVCKVDIIDVVAPESYLDYGDEWDESIPDIPHPLIGTTFPRLEKYIWDDMAKFFAKAVAKWA